MKNRILAGILGAFTGLVFTTAYASIPAPTGTINGCYTIADTNGLHALGVIDSTGTCPAGTTPLNWSQSSGFTNYEVISVTVLGPAHTFVVASCSTGKSILGGGAEINPKNGPNAIESTRPTDTNNGWEASYETNIGVQSTLTVWAICANT